VGEGLILGALVGKKVGPVLIVGTGVGDLVGVEDGVAVVGGAVGVAIG
jgi:hypothetical protein